MFCEISASERPQMATLLQESFPFLRSAKSCSIFVSKSQVQCCNFCRFRSNLHCFARDMDQLFRPKPRILIQKIIAHFLWTLLHIVVHTLAILAQLRCTLAHFVHTLAHFVHTLAHFVHTLAHFVHTLAHFCIFHKTNLIQSRHI